MAEDGLAREILAREIGERAGAILRVLAGTDDREARGLEDLGELERDVREHVVVLRVLRVRRVQVEPRACEDEMSSSSRARAGVLSGERTCSEVPVGILALDACASRGGVREQQSNALLRGGAQEASFLRAVRCMRNSRVALETGSGAPYIPVVLSAGEP